MATDYDIPRKTDDDPRLGQRRGAARDLNPEPAD